jgi:predicted XRE-type DNA-binding protein
MHRFFVDHFTLERYSIDKSGRRRLKPFLEVWRHGTPVEAVEVIESANWRTEVVDSELERLEGILQICKQNRDCALLLHLELNPFFITKLIRFGIHESRFSGGLPASEDMARLAIRAKLMVQIAGFLMSKGWKEEEAAQRCGLNPMRVSDLLRGGISRFSVEELVNIALELGLVLRIEIESS